MTRFLDELISRFGGYSEEGITKGRWIDPKDFQRYGDETRRVSVVCGNDLLWDAREVVTKIGKELGQRAMYFEVRDYDGVQILEVPSD